MPIKNNNPEKISLEQHELLEKAQQRIRQKKRLYYHFILFLIGSIFFIVLNKFLNYGEPYNWYVWAIFLWLFFLLLHVVNVYITHPFLDNDWERAQREKLVAKQQEKIAAIQKEIEEAHPLPNPPKTDTEL
ncbi:2TM domain-containing protein [Leptobacterium sp. I13]|uniref:2TM domain-containing protein n=1 Tax=Leptobacterium meishanense TaxID=3128904 RepID=UPI0030EB44CA